MNLPNFVNFAPFNNLRKKMGTIKLGQFDVKNCRNGVPGYGLTAARTVATDLARNPQPGGSTATAARPARSTSGSSASGEPKAKKAKKTKSKSVNGKTKPKASD